MARLYGNENFPLPVVEALRQLGHDVLTVQERGQGNEAVADTEVLAFAVENDRAVVTLNRRDFLRLHATQPEHAGIIVCTVDLNFAQQAQRIHAAIETAGDLRGQVIRVNRPSP